MKTTRSKILQMFDDEIVRLNRLRAKVADILLEGEQADADRLDKSMVPKRKRNMTPEGSKRISEAVSRRWAKQKAAEAQAAA